MEELPPAYDQKGMENHGGAGSSRPTVSAIVSVGSSHSSKGSWAAAAAQLLQHWLLLGWLLS